MQDKPSSVPQQSQQVDHQTAAIVDPQVLASLLPSFVELYEAAASGSASQLDVAKLASGLKASIAKAQQQARDMPGADLTLSDQRRIIDILEKELALRRPVSGS